MSSDTNSPTIPDDYLSFEKDDFQRGLLVKVQGWHKVKIVSYEKKMTKEKQIRNSDGTVTIKQPVPLHIYRLQGLDESDAGRKGVFLSFMVSANAPKSIHAMLVAALDPEASKQPGYKYNPKNAEGKIVEANINYRRRDENDPDSLQNNVKDFRPAKD